MFGYRARLERNVERWHDVGWVTDEGLKAIRAETVASNSRFGLASALGVLGAVLIGFAAMSFVAANWQSMSKLARLAVVFSSLWVCYGFAAVLYRRHLQAFAHAAVLAGITVFGAGIMLIAQIYHMDGNPPDAVLVWALGALATGILLKSNPATAAAIVLASFWSGWHTITSHVFHWEFLLLWTACAATFYWLKWRPGFHLVALSLSLWVVFSRVATDGGYSYLFVAVFGIAIALIGALGGSFIDRHVRISKAIVGYGIAVGFTGLFTIQFIDHLSRHYSFVWFWAILTLALLIATVFWGWLNDNKAALWLGYIGFSVEILSLYFKTLGTLLGTSLFFLIAGILVVALSWMAFQLHKRQLTIEEAAI